MGVSRYNRRAQVKDRLVPVEGHLRAHLYSVDQKNSTRDPRGGVSSAQIGHHQVV